MTSVKFVIQCTYAYTTVLSTSTCSTSNSTTHGSITLDGYSVTWLHMINIHSSASGALIILNIKVHTSGTSNCALERITFPRFTSSRSPTALSSSPTKSTWLGLLSLFTQTSNTSFYQWTSAKAPLTSNRTTSLALHRASFAQQSLRSTISFICSRAIIQ